MKKIISSILVAGALSSVSSAATISINFTRIAADNLGSAEEAGVEAVSNWTNLSGTSTSGTDLNTDSGASTVDFARTGNAGAFNGGSVNTDTANNTLQSGYADVGAATVTWTFSDLNTNGFTTYDVIVYTAGGANSGRFGDYTIGGTTIRSTDVASFDSAGAGFIESTGTSGSTTNGNYVRFTGITGDSFSLAAIGANTGTARGPVSGIQIVATAVPEPSAAALLGLGGVALILRRRK